MEIKKIYCDWCDKEVIVSKSLDRVSLFKYTNWLNKDIDYEVCRSCYTKAELIIRNLYNKLKKKVKK